MTVKTTPAAITGTTTVCQGLTTALADATTGGTWSSSNTSVATVNSATGLVGGVSNGTTTITYDNAGCGTATTTVTGRTAPAAISGATALCTALQTTLTDAISGGTWTSSNTARASVNSATGLVTGVGAGAVTITYAMGCGTNATLGMTVSTSPAAISGASTVCTTTPVTLTDATTLGVWSTSDASIATVIASGRVTGIIQGNVTISYTKTGCSALKAVTVTAAPSAISGVSNICLGNTATLTNTSNNGTWSSSNSGVASVNSVSGLVTSVTAGAATITYNTGCGSNATKALTVLTTPAAITGTTTVCNGSNTTLSDVTGGGAWSSSNTSIASVSATGVVSGVSQGNATITYSISGCLSTASATVINTPSAISGTTSICMGNTSALTNTANSGTWSSSNSSVASVDPSGLVTSVATGNATITYTTGCGSAATAAVNIGLAPAAISGSSSICVGNTTPLTETVPAGTWSSSNAAIATVNASGTVTAVAEGSATISYSLTNGCGANVVTQPMAVSITGKWAGTSSSDWNDAANWPCGVIPDATVDVIIPAGTTFHPDFSAATFTVRNLTINSGVEVPISSDATINIKGDLTNNGTIDGDGNILMDNSSAQKINGNGKISNLTLSNTAGTSINSGDSVKITGDLTLTAGIFATNGGLVLFADNTTMGRIAPITGGSISGNVNVMQYIQGGYRRYRFFSHPFSSAISLSQLERSIDITGAGGSANGFTQTGSNAASAFRYDVFNSNSAASYDPGWKTFTKINGTEADSNKMGRYQGIRLFMRGAKGEGLGYDFSYTPSAAIIGMYGPINQGNQTVTLSKGTGANQDYNMLGNPYPSVVDLGTAMYNAKVAGNIVGSAYFVWNPSLGASGQFQAIPIGVGAPISYYIQPNTAFQVRAAHNGDALHFTESDKSTTANSSLLKAQPDHVSLYIYDNNNHPWDMLSVKFNDDATDNEDNDYDAAKPSGADFNFYSLSADNHKLSIDARPFNTDKVIPLGISSAYAQSFTIKAEGIAIPQGGSLYLHDKLLNTYTLLQNDAEYTFSVTKDKNTQGENRFELAMKPSGTAITANNDNNISVSPNPATDQVTIHYTAKAGVATSINVLNVSGVSVFNQTMGTQPTGTATIPLSQLPAGIYMVEVVSGDTKKVQRLVKE